MEQELVERLETIDHGLRDIQDLLAANALVLNEGLTKVHQWQAEQPTGKELKDQREEVLEIYGGVVQDNEAIRRMWPALRDVAQGLEKAIKRIDDLEAALRLALAAGLGEGATAPGG